MKKTNKKANNLRDGGAATDFFNLSGLSKKELLKLWDETAEKLRETNPLDNIYEWKALQVYFDAIVEAFYADWDGNIKLGEGKDDE